MRRKKKLQCLHNENEIDKKMKVKNVIWKWFRDTTNVIVVKMAIKSANSDFTTHTHTPYACTKIVAAAPAPQL